MESNFGCITTRPVLSIHPNLRGGGELSSLLLAGTNSFGITVEAQAIRATIKPSQKSVRTNEVDVALSELFISTDSQWLLRT